MVFDYDGTLVASRSADESAVAQLVEEDPSAAPGAAIFWGHDGEPLARRIELAWPGRVSEVLALFERQVQPARFPGVLRVVEELGRLRLRLGVVSSRRVVELERSLAATGLGRHFPVVIGLDDVGEPKPSPEGLLLALARLGVAPGRAVFVGDNQLDLEAGLRAGVTVWMAAWGPPLLDPLAESSNGTVLLRRPEEVIERLVGLGRR
ncbi:MAG: HAD family hydrolase [Candidatus Dormibacteria bacterium]